MSNASTSEAQHLPGVDGVKGSMTHGMLLDSRIRAPASSCDDRPVRRRLASKPSALHSSDSPGHRAVSKFYSHKMSFRKGVRQSRTRIPAAKDGLGLPDGETSAGGGVDWPRSSFLAID